MEIFGIILAFALIIIPVLALAATPYVLGAIGHMKMLKRVGYKRTWLAWIPIANVKAIGDLADFYDNGEPPRRCGTRLLWLYVAFAAVTYVFTLAYTMGGHLFPEVVTALMTVFMFAILLPLIILIGIDYYRSLWAIYRIFSPERSIAFLIVSIIVSSPLPEIFMFVCRNGEPQNLRGAEQKPQEFKPENPYHYE